MAQNSSNALGLDFSQQTAEETREGSQEPVDVESPSQTVPPDASRKEHKEKPYVNPERVKTGGSQRDKLSDEALEERMTRIREQNEKIKQRRIDVQADEAAFRQTQELERAKQVQNRKIQSEIDRARDQNAQRKMAKVQSREWDSGKPSNDRSGPRNVRPQPSSSQTDPAPQVSAPDTAAPSSTTAPEANAESGGNWVRGGHAPPHPRGRGRGRGRGAGGRGGSINNRREIAQSITPVSEAPKTEASDQAPST
ncbi:hypothetical protein CVT25_015504 [Psilocybe cyanescens]|uniref:Uncharacterized protein n=1 Tax=Psilocybe cyanescens TaxID=93625 RepID=A0A409WI72_PSICY|nr:hypothetical protein CVT25_015504 [Psilocybe cyanescens]